MSTVEIEGSRFEYFDEGVGDPVVLVHGSASDYRTWENQRDAFSERLRVITYSRRYHWPNRPIAEGSDYSMSQHVSDLRELLNALGAVPAHLVGHSYGGFVSLLLAVQEPRLVRSLVLAEPPVVTLFVSNRPRVHEVLKLFFTRPRTAVAIMKLAATGLGPATEAARRNDMDEAIRRFGAAVLGREWFDNLSESRREQVRVNLTRAEFLGSGFPPLDTGLLRELRVPTLLLTARASCPAFHRLVDRLEEVLPVTKRAEITDASHNMHEDNPVAFNRTVLSFIMGNDLTRA